MTTMPSDDDTCIECDNCGDKNPKSQVNWCPCCDWTLCSKCGECLCAGDDFDDEEDDDEQD